MSETLRKLKVDFSKVATIGCSCGGVIFKGKGRSENTLVSITELDMAEATVASVRLFNGSEMRKAKHVAEELAAKLNGIDNSTLLIFFSSRWYHAASLSKALSGLGEGFTIIGGGTYSATGDEIDDPNYTICNGESSCDELVCAKISGDSFFSTTRMANGVEALGKAYPVTKTDGHVLKEIDGKIYKRKRRHCPCISSCA